MKYRDVIRPICFHLPQFHSFKENNIWWGEGFTEWTNVKKIEHPLAPGHVTKHPHDDIGYYDFLDINVRAQQGSIANRYGVYGFCYHTYWFNGQRLMDGGLEKMLIDNQPDLPFCFHWANESWTRTWDGLEKNVLMRQDYGLQDEWEKQIVYWDRFFQKDNYIKVSGCPLIVVYRPRAIPKLEARVAYWRERAREMGWRGLHVLMMLNIFRDGKYTDELGSVFDGVIQYEPNNVGFLVKDEFDFPGSLTVIDINRSWQEIEISPKVCNTHYRGTFPCWDNTPRRPETGVIFSGTTRQGWRNHLRKMFQQAVAEMSDYTTPTFFFINAWNEWAEGCAMEPSQEDGYMFLEVLREILEENIPDATNRPPK